MFGFVVHIEQYNFKGKSTESIFFLMSFRDYHGKKLVNSIIPN